MIRKYIKFSAQLTDDKRAFYSIKSYLIVPSPRVDQNTKGGSYKITWKVIPLQLVLLFDDVMMTYQEVLDYLYLSLPMYQRVGNAAIKKDLTNTLILCQQLGDPQHQFRSVHVAGTNGKGSSAHSIAAVLQTAGYKTGLYTSPHLKNFTERIRINGMEMSQEAVIDFVVKHKSLLEEVKPSFFEMTVVLAFDYFAKEQVDIAVVEVGLGGRLDSTNVIHPEVSLITNIGYDHMDMLGDTLAQIAYEKGGIIKPEVPVVIGEKHPETTPVFLKLADERKAPLYFAQEAYAVKTVGLEEGQFAVQVYQGAERVYENLRLALGGYYQKKNLPGILTSLALLQDKGWHIQRDHIILGLGAVTRLTGLKGRWQQLATQPLMICDTGHNAEAFREISAQLASMSYANLHMVLGFSGDKDVEKVFHLLPLQAQYYFCQAQVPRAMDATVLQEKGKQAGLRGEAFATVAAAIQRARDNAQPQDLIFIGGSTFVVAEISEL